MALSSIVDRLTRHRWTGAEATALAGDVNRSFIAHAAEAQVREKAASGGAVSALLLAALDAGLVDGVLVCVTNVEDGRVRARYRIARTRDEVLAAQGSTYVLGDFAREALPLIRSSQGRLAVVALPCEITLLRRDDSLRAKTPLVLALFCGHTTETLLVDGLVRRLSKEAGGAALESFRFRTGHWRGRLVATFDDGTVVEKPASHYLLYHNLYFGSPKKCVFCGDHFGYGADLSAGDIWSQKYRDDEVKHTALLSRTDAGATWVEEAIRRGALVARSVPVEEVLDGQRRTAPFHFNTTARALEGRRLGLAMPDRVRTETRLHERLSARITLRNHLATRDEAGCERVLRANRRMLKARLYLLKALESLPVGPLVPGPAPDAPRFSVIAATVHGNRGAEAMLETSIGRIRDRFPDAVFSVYSYYPKADRRLIRDPSVTVHSSTPAALVLSLFPLSLLAAPFARLTGHVPRVFPRSVRDLATSRALIDLAGVSFIDGREKFLPFNILTILPAVLLSVPVFKLAQALGPFRNPLNRAAARILRRCTLVVPRGDVTLGHMREIAFPEQLMHPAPDVAFLFESRDSLSDEGMDEAQGIAALAAEARNAGRAVVGICPSAVLDSKARSEGWDYAGFVAEFASGLVADGHTVLLFPNATRAGSPKPRNNDLPLIAEIRRRLGEDQRVIAVSGDMNAAALRTVIGSCSCVAVSRFHAMVGALSIGVPVAVVGWSHKYLEVMKQFGLEGFVFDYSTRDAAGLQEIVDRLLREHGRHASTIAERLPLIREDAASQFEAVFRRL